MGHSFAVSSVSLFVHLFIIGIYQIIKGLRILGKKFKPLGRLVQAARKKVQICGRWVLSALNVKGNLVITFWQEKQSDKRNV